MFKRSLVFIVLIVCVLSLISINNISYAGTSLGTWLNAERDVRNAERVMNTERDNYHYIQGDLKSLMGEWDDAEIANNNQRLLSVLAVGGAIVSVASGGSLYPAAYVVAVTLAKTNHNEATYDVQKSAYLTSMSGLLSLMDTARSNVDAAYNSGYLSKEPKGAYTGSVGYIEYTPGYVPEYNAYLQVALDHLNSYQYYQGNDYNNVVTLTLAGLTASVKSGTLKGWYHKKYHDGDKNSKTDHGFEKFMTFADFVVHPDLPKNYA
ncbi:MAG: hypothetical protein OXU23_07280, partial [Candidatus Poribacteria bacterium]|nr:hypothetical protein [Candidatus Poribacteria bacterium]